MYLLLVEFKRFSLFCISTNKHSLGTDKCVFITLLEIGLQFQGSLFIGFLGEDLAGKNK